MLLFLCGPWGSLGAGVAGGFLGMLVVEKGHEGYGDLKELADGYSEISRDFGGSCGAVSGCIGGQNAGCASSDENEKESLKHNDNNDNGFFSFFRLSWNRFLD